MQISQTSNQSFEGAFRIKPNEIKAKTEIPQLLNRGRQIFSDVLESGDKFIVVRDQYDKRIGRYIRENRVRGVEYYPEINTKCGLDDQEPEGLLKLAKNKGVRIITDINKIYKASMASKKLTKAEEQVDKIANALRLNIENPQIISTKASTIVKDKLKGRTIEIIMQNRGTTYVHVKPDRPYEESIKCIIDGQGKVVKKFETPEEIMKFLKQFRKLKQEEMNIITDK